MECVQLGLFAFGAWGLTISSVQDKKIQDEDLPIELVGLRYAQ